MTAGIRAMDWKIGQTFKLDGGRGIVAGSEIPPVWYALIVPPQKEKATCAYLRARGVYAFYPSQERQWRARGKRVKRTFPIVSQYIYAQFRQAPQWDVMKERRRLITGTFSANGQPIQIPPEVIRRLHGLSVDAERLREAKREMMRLRPGDQAMIDEGPLAGFLVDVYRVSEGQAWFSFITGGKGTANLGVMTRVLPDGQKVVIEDPTAPDYGK